MDYESSKNANATAKVHHTSREAIYRWEESAPLLAQWEIEFKEGSLSEPLYKRHIEEVLNDAPRPGKPPVFTEEQKKEIIALSKQEPQKEGVPVSRWTHTILRDTAIEKGIVASISPSRLGIFLKRKPA
jgi:hypothetical protein